MISLRGNSCVFRQGKGIAGRTKTICSTNWVPTWFPSSPKIGWSPSPPQASLCWKVEETFFCIPSGRKCPSFSSIHRTRCSHMPQVFVLVSRHPAPPESETFNNLTNQTSQRSELLKKKRQLNCPRPQSLQTINTLLPTRRREAVGYTRCATHRSRQKAYSPNQTKSQSDKKDPP